MAYFSNATEGLDYEEKWCSSCVHYEGCTIMRVHLSWNWYQFYEAESESINDVLETLIPTGDDRSPAKCSMYLKSSEMPDKQTVTGILFPDGFTPIKRT